MSAELGLLSKRDGEPLFAEPWQAQVMALAAQLVETGTITAGHWATTGPAQQRAEPAAAKTPPTPGNVAFMESLTVSSDYSTTA